LITFCPSIFPRRIEPIAAKTGKDKAAVTAVGFAPRILQDGSAVLAIGMESGNIELWALGSNEDEAASPCRLLFAVPSNLCHIADVKRIAFRPHDAEEEIVFASCGMDNGVRIFSVLLR